MKLIDLLVQELPKRGGWPKGAEFAHCLGFQIGFYMGNRATIMPQWTTGLLPSPDQDRVTRAQYEDALAASSPRPGSLLQYGASGDEWDGVGMPPVGCEFEMAYYLSNDWKKCVLIAHGEEQIIFKYDGEREFSGHRSNYQFRPLTIRSETDKKRDAAVSELVKIIGGPGGPYAEVKAAQIYDAIKSGDIVIE